MRYISSCILAVICLLFLGLFSPLLQTPNLLNSTAYAVDNNNVIPPLPLCSNDPNKVNPANCPGLTNTDKVCGDPGTPDNPKSSYIVPSIDLGCRGKGNGILDLAFAIIRFLSVGVGLIVIGSIVLAGIQYSSSRGDPQATANAVKRISSTVIALVIYIFAFAILNWLIPGAVLK